MVLALDLSLPSALCNSLRHVEEFGIIVMHKVSLTNGKFLVIHYYIQILRMVATSMRSLGSYGMFYLAAAVSDFYVPWESMV